MKSKLHQVVEFIDNTGGMYTNWYKVIEEKVDKGDTYCKILPSVTPSIKMSSTQKFAQEQGGLWVKTEDLRIV